MLELLGRVEMVNSARRAVTGDGVCIGLTYKDQAFVHPKTKKCRGLIKETADEIKSNDELNTSICFTSIQNNHNTFSAPHTDNILEGCPFIAIGLGDYV